MVWIRLFVSFAFLVVLGFTVDLRVALATFRDLELPWLAALLGVNASAYGLWAWRWQLLARSEGIPLRYSAALQGIFLLQGASQVVPVPFVADAARAATVPPNTPPAALVRSIVLDRVASLVSLALFVTALLPFYLRLPYPGELRWVLLVPGAALLATVIAARWTSTSEGRLAFLRKVTRPRDAAAPVLLGIAISLVLGFEFFLAARALAIAPAPDAGLILLVPVLSLFVSLVPISLADWGSREAVALVTLTPYLDRAEDIVAVSLLIGFTNLLCAIPGALAVISVARSR